MKKTGTQKILASIGTHPGQHWDFQYFKSKEILPYIYDRLIDVLFGLHPERKAIAIENLETNFGQHWDHSGQDIGPLVYQKQRELTANLK